MTGDGKEQGKRTAAAMALSEVQPGMRLGLGSGSTAEWFVRLLGERIAAEGLTVECAASSQRTAALAAGCGVQVQPLDEFVRLDLYVDGADEIDPQLGLIKGGGACHLIEKIVAAASDRFIVIADDSKLVDTLGAFPLPVEIARYGWASTARRVEATLAGLGYTDPQVARRDRDGEPLFTDEKNLILDCQLGRIPEPQALASELNAIPGVVEHGLFIGMADAAMIGAADGTARRMVPSNAHEPKGDAA